MSPTPAPAVEEIEVAPRSGRGCRHILRLRPGRARDMDWQLALCGARPRSGWSTDASKGTRFCYSCQEQLDAEEEAATARVWTSQELFQSSWVASVLQGEIAAGCFLPGSLFPTQEEIEERFSISNTTVRKAWGMLKARGLIATEWHATYVTGGSEGGRHDR